MTRAAMVFRRRPQTAAMASARLRPCRTEDKRIRERADPKRAHRRPTFAPARFGGQRFAMAAHRQRCFASGQGKRRYVKARHDLRQSHGVDADRLAGAVGNRRGAGVVAVRQELQPAFG
jgi:hypothetical protein